MFGIAKTFVGTNEYDCYEGATEHNDTQHNDTQHNDTQHNGTQHNDTQPNDTQHKGLFSV
jgi:hypothetical protein